MKQAETHKDCDGQIWFSPEFIKDQIELAYMVGLSAGLKIDFHAMEPYSNEAIESLEIEFWRRVNLKYSELLNELYERRKTIKNILGPITND